MSWRLRDLVDETALPPTQYRVLVTLVRYVNDKRYGATGETVVWPSVDELMARSRLSRNAVRRSIAALRAIGVISVVQEATKNTSTHYRIVVPNLRMLAESAAQEEAAKAEYRRAGRGAPTNPRSADRRGAPTNPRSDSATRVSNEFAEGSQRSGRGVAANPELEKELQNDCQEKDRRNDGAVDAPRISAPSDPITAPADGITECMVAIASVSPAGTDLERIRRRLSRYRAEHPKVDLAGQVGKWAARAQENPVRNAESALLKWLDRAWDAEAAPKGTKRSCAVAGCDRVGRGALGRCVDHTRCRAVGCREFGTVVRGDIPVCAAHEDATDTAESETQRPTNGHQANGEGDDDVNQNAPDEDLSVRVAALPEDIRAWMGTTIGNAIRTGMDPVVAWRVGVIDVLDRFADAEQHAVFA